MKTPLAFIINTHASTGGIHHVIACRPGENAMLTELAVDKTTAGEAPHPFARVIVLRLLDGKKVWEGFADEHGRWQAQGLHPGLEYVAVGIDQKRIFKATAAGPVTATVPADDATGGGNG